MRTCDAAQAAIGADVATLTVVERQPSPCMALHTLDAEGGMKGAGRQLTCVIDEVQQAVNHAGNWH